MVYMGSKQRIAKYIVPIIQECIDDNGIENYIETFCGGCNVIDKIKCTNRYANDNNKYLIALFQALIDNVELLPNVDRELYNKVRTEYNNNNKENLYPNWIIGNIGYLASYNGRGFSGGYAQNGYEKTKNGERFRNYYQEAKNNLLKQKDNLRDVKFSCNDYGNLKNVKNYFIYLDPPYENTKQYETSKGFNHNDFWKWVETISKDNYVVISEQNSRNNFEIIWQQEVSRSIKAVDKSKSTEKLFTHKDGLFYKYWRSKNGK